MKSPTNIVCLAAFAALVGTGCYTERHIIREPAGATVDIREPAGATIESAPVTTRTTVRETVVVEPPPAPQSEVVGVAPSGEHVWIPGQWTRSGDRWVWMSGRWEARPTPISVYVPGHWESRGDGYVWREGYWK